MKIRVMDKLARSVANKIEKAIIEEGKKETTVKRKEKSYRIIRTTKYFKE